MNSVMSFDNLQLNITSCLLEIHQTLPKGLAHGPSEKKAVQKSKRTVRDGDETIIKVGQ